MCGIAKLFATFNNTLRQGESKPAAKKSSTHGHWLPTAAWPCAWQQLQTVYRWASPHSERRVTCGASQQHTSASCFATTSSLSKNLIEPSASLSMYVPSSIASSTVALHQKSWL